MAEDSWPSVDHDTGEVQDLEYEQLAYPVMGNGVVGSPSDLPVVFGDSTSSPARAVKWRANTRAHVRGHIWSPDTDVIIQAGANSAGSTRYDLAVLRMDRGSNWNVRAALRAGTAGAGVPAPVQNLGGSGVWELPMAKVAVLNGATVIRAIDVTPLAWYLAPQSVVCTSTTRPPPLLGLRILEADTGKEYRGDGSKFVSALEDTGWVAATASSGWTTGAAARRYNGVAYVNGIWTRTGNNLGASAGAYQMGSVPINYQPSRPIHVTAYLDGGNAVLANVNPDRSITITSEKVGVAKGLSVTITEASWPLG